MANNMLKRVEELMDIVTEETPPNDPNFVELDLLADLAEEYEMEYYPIEQTSIYGSKKMYRNLNVDANLIPA